MEALVVLMIVGVVGYGLYRCGKRRGSKSGYFAGRMHRRR